jgi:twitching motility two-component system response regulator PilH
MQFLVVDDSAVDRHLLTSILETMGHQVDACSTAVGTLERISSGNYKAVFLDIVMPEQDGYKFLRELRSNEKTAKQHVIFCSSKVTPVEVNYGIKRAGADDYITKPATPDSVAQALQKVA